MSQHRYPPMPEVTRFRDVDEFVRHFLVNAYRRQIGQGKRWCAQWWRHQEAVERLTLVWQAWERMWPHPGEQSAWWLDFAEPHMSELMAADGPFEVCTPQRHRDGDAPGNPDYGIPPLPMDPPPSGMFEPLRPRPDVP